MKQRVEKQIGKEILWFETGELAKQAAGACLCGYGDSSVIATVTIADAKEGQDFFPLTCDYRERSAAAGKFPGGFIKREGKPSLKETLTARLMDRPIRPLFPDGYCNEIQIQSFALSSDRQHDTDVLAMNGSSMALCLSPAPFIGPISAVRLARINGELVPFPSQEELEESDLDLVISGSDESIVMIEGFAREMPEAEMLECVLTAHKYIKEINALQREMIDLVKPVKAEYTPVPDCTEVYEKIKADFYDKLAEVKHMAGKLARAAAVDEVKEAATAVVIPDPEAEDAVPELVFRFRIRKRKTPSRNSYSIWRGKSWNSALFATSFWLANALTAAVWKTSARWNAALAFCPAFTDQPSFSAAKPRRLSPLPSAPLETISALTVCLKSIPKSSCWTTTSRRLPLANASLCVVLDAANTVTELWQNDPFAPSFRITKFSRTRFALFPTSWKATVPAPWRPFAARRWV